MDRETGSRTCPIWLIGDSEPTEWKDSLKTPLDPRHPIRHNIWTSILDIVQDAVYRSSCKRIDTSQLYIRNAICNSEDKPKPSEISTWNSEVIKEMSIFQKLITDFKPIILLTFGAFSYEFCSRSVYKAKKNSFIHWDTSELGKEFLKNVNDFNISSTNILPLLHRSISGGKFLTSHAHFCNNPEANYFTFVGERIANLIIENKKLHSIYIAIS